MHIIASLTILGVLGIPLPIVGQAIDPNSVDRALRSTPLPADAGTSLKTGLLLIWCDSHVVRQPEDIMSAALLTGVGFVNLGPGERLRSGMAAVRG